MDHDETILTRYLDGELSEDEKIALELEISAHPELQEELESLRSTREAVKFYGLKQRVAEIHGEMMKELSSRPKKLARVSKLVRYTVAIAASLLLIIGGYAIYNFVTLSSEKVYTAHYQPYELVNVRDTQSSDSEVEKAFREKNYRKVISLNGDKKNATAKENFIYGASELELKDNIKAIDFFKKAQLANKKTTQPVLSDEIEYYLALAYIRNRDYDYALDLLKKISNDPNHVYHGKVTTRMMRQVKMLKWR